MPPARLDDVQDGPAKEGRRFDDFERLARAGLEGAHLPLTQMGIILKFMTLNEDETVLLDGYARTIAGKIKAMAALLFPILSIKRNLSAMKLRNGSLEQVPQAFKVAHDLNNMLTLISGNIELSQLASLPKKDLIRKAWAAYLVAEGTLLEALGESPENAINLAQLRYKLEISLKPFHGNLTGDVPSDKLDAKVALSTGQLGRLVFDLLDNAKKAGATRSDITVLCEERGVVVLIKDNGPGFQGVDPFEASRLSKARHPEHGNGIAICKDLCEGAGGTLTLSDANDATGAQWKIRLPFSVDQC